MLTGERMPKGPPADWSALKQIKFDPMQAAKEPVKWNFSPWCDFRTYMDDVLAKTLDTIRQAAHEVDPNTPVGIEGAQMPHAFGGYDLWKLSQSVDWMEPYDVACSREILGDFMPGKPLFCTLFEKDAEHAMRRLWHLLLLGDKGCIVWWSEDCIDASKPDSPLTEKGKALAPVFREMQSPLAKLFMLAQRETDPIAIHYSQTSIQVAWLMESVADGKSWPRRFSSFESGHSRHAAVRNGWLKLLQDAGYSPQFISNQQLEEGVLRDIRVLVLPQSHALSDSQFAAVDQFWNGSEVARMVCGSDTIGYFDARGTFQAKRASRWLNRMAGGTPWWYKTVSPDFSPNGWGGFGSEISTQLKLRKGVVEEIPSYSPVDWPNGVDPIDKMTEEEREEWSGAMPGLQMTNQIKVVVPPVIQVPRRACVRTHRYRLSTARLLAFERGVDYHMSEDLKQAGGNEPLEKPITFTAKLAEKAHVYDLRSGAYLGERDNIPVDLNPWKPSLFALLPEKLPEGRGVVEALLLESRRDQR
jgi:hypothetical protein